MFLVPWEGPDKDNREIQYLKKMREGKKFPECYLIANEQTFLHTMMSEWGVTSATIHRLSNHTWYFFKKKENGSLQNYMVKGAKVLSPPAEATTTPTTTGIAA